ncbi:hypothetical protein SAMN05216203_1380 [Marinobacter daqiaonensis]|uniref:Outer membrane protein beta-barrel domain-containing protein n=2 Tax=Marinobacter daqiaonensis TaxID=650891 RepID=A0A1I6HNR5_9GAMM|nr:hypothetical protein SAMN05216203_1380 [Marinobacter daqiaonensis]
MKNGIRGLTAAAMLLPVAAMAESLSYSYLEGGVALYPDFESEDFIGLDTRGSLALNENVFVFGGLKYLTDDVDLTALHVGGGYRHGLDARTDLWGGVTLEYQELDWNSAEVDDTGLGIRGGLRHQLTNELEVGVGGRVITGDLDYVGFTGTARYAIERDFKVFAELDVYDGEPGIIGGVTFEF